MTPKTAGEFALRAAELVAGDREKQHGRKEQNFGNIAAMINAYLGIRRDPAAPLDALDVGHIMVLLKIARTQTGSDNPDDYIDACGYAACAGEIVATRLQSVVPGAA